MHDALEFDDCARRLKALADSERLKIVEALFAGEKSVSEIAAELDEEVVNVSHHLGVLKNAGLVCAERKGRFIIYSLAREVRASKDAEASRQIDLGCCSLEIPSEDARPAKSKRK